LCPNSPPTPVDVAVAVLWRAARGRREVLLTRRPHDVHLGGAWELPGGKIQSDETAEQALRRELDEEIGVTPRELEALTVTEHQYPDRLVRLHAMAARVATAVTIEHRGVIDHCWVDVDNLGDVELPPANAPITAAIRRVLGGRVGGQGAHPRQ